MLIPLELGVDGNITSECALAKGQKPHDRCKPIIHTTRDFTI